MLSIHRECESVPVASGFMSHAALGILCGLEMRSQPDPDSPDEPPIPVQDPPPTPETEPPGPIREPEPTPPTRR